MSEAIDKIGTILCLNETHTPAKPDEHFIFPKNQIDHCLLSMSIRRVKFMTNALMHSQLNSWTCAMQ